MARKPLDIPFDDDEPTSEFEVRKTTTAKTLKLPITASFILSNGVDYRVDGLHRVNRCTIAGQDHTDLVTVVEIGVLHWVGRGAGFLELMREHGSTVRMVIEGQFDASA